MVSNILLAFGTCFFLCIVRCMTDKVYMQVISPQRQHRFVVVPPRKSTLYRAGIEPQIAYSTVYTKTPSELMDIFCTDVFNKSTNVLMVISYASDTRVTVDYIYDIAHRLGYPVIMWDPLYKGSIESYNDRQMLQLATTIYHDCTAVFKILMHYNWTEFAVVTTKQLGDDFIQCLDDMVSETSVRQGYLSIPRNIRFKKIATVILDTSDWKYGTPSDKQQAVAMEEMTKLRAQSRIIILHADADSVLSIGEIAESMDLTKGGYGWIVTSQGAPERMTDFTLFPVGFLVISQNRSMEMVEQSLDLALKFWTGGLEQMVGDGLLATTDLQPDYSCSSGNVSSWAAGETIYRYMKKVVVSEIGLDVSFTDSGIIRHIELFLYNVRPVEYRRRTRKRYSQVGRLFPAIVDNRQELKMETNEILWPGGGRIPPLGRPERRYFRLVTKQEPPFVIYVPPGEDGQCGQYAVECWVNSQSINWNGTANDTVRYCCTGLCIEVLQVLADKMRFDFELYDVPDGQWGVRDDNGEWSGLVKEVLDGKADMVLTAFIINQVRNKAIDFSVSYLESGITIMVSIRKGAISPYAFLEPYDFYSWILILIFSVHATGASIFIFEWFSPSGLAQGETSTVEHKFSLFRSFWLIWAMLFGAAVSIDVPRGVSSRFLANVWALFALVFLASYTANLAAFMITIDEYYDLSGIEDWRLLNPTKLTPHFKFATIANSSTDVNLQYNYRKMHNYMKKYTQPDITSAKLSLKNQSIHAFIYDANVLEYTAGRDETCSLLTVGKWYAMSGYGVGLKKGSELKPEVDKILLDLIYNGEIERLQAFWLSGACHAKKDKKKTSNNKIGILNFISAFILLAAGVFLGVLLLALEHLYFKSGRKCLKKYDKCGCCELVSLSMGKSLTFEQSVFTAIDINKKHKCKDPICEMHLWKARHQLDMALIKMKSLQDQLDQTSSTLIALEEQGISVL